MDFWAPGTQVRWCYGDPGLDFVAPARVVADDEQALAGWVPAGTPVLKLVREDGRDLRADPTDAFLVPRRQVESVWVDHSVLRVYLPGRSWSVWCFFEETSGDFEGWYVNLEAPHVRRGRETRSRDHVLDLWVEPDRSVERKDEDELVLAVEQGRFTEAEAAGVRATADEVEEIVRAWGRPFCDGWEGFRPDPSWPVPVLS